MPSLPQLHGTYIGLPTLRRVYTGSNRASPWQQAAKRKAGQQCAAAAVCMSRHRPRQPAAKLWAAAQLPVIVTIWQAADATAHQKTLRKAGPAELSSHVIGLQRHMNKMKWRAHRPLPDSGRALLLSTAGQTRSHTPPPHIAGSCAQAMPR